MLHIIQKSLLLPVRTVKKYSKLTYLCRTFTSSKSLASNYEGDGKTVVQILNNEYKHLVMINTLSNFGFRLNNGIFAVGPLAAFPRTILQWNINDVEEITPESLSLFCLLEPKLDMLIIGSGEKRMLPNEKVLEYLKSNKISTEILSTYQACSIFNFLNAEGRYVAGAFIPPKEIYVYEDEYKIMDTVEAMDDYGVIRRPKIET